MEDIRMKLFKLLIITISMTLWLFGGDKFIASKMGDISIESVNEYEHWLIYQGKRIQKFEERYVTFNQHFEGESKVIVILNLDTGTSLVKPEYAIIEIANGDIRVSNRVISYDYTFKITKATSKKVVMDVGLSPDGIKRTAIYQNGKITVQEAQPKFNATTSMGDIEAQKRAILANLNSFFSSENRLEGDLGIDADDGSITVYKKDNFDVRYAKLMRYNNDGVTSKEHYYFKDNKPFYVETTTTYTPEFAASAGIPASQKDIKKYYFTNDKLTRYEENGQVNTSHIANREQYIMKIANAIVNQNTCDQ